MGGTGQGEQAEGSWHDQLWGSRAEGSRARKGSNSPAATVMAATFQSQEKNAGNVSEYRGRVVLRYKGLRNACWWTKSDLWNLTESLSKPCSPRPLIPWAQQGPAGDGQLAGNRVRTQRRRGQKNHSLRGPWGQTSLKDSKAFHFLRIPLNLSGINHPR